MILFTFLVWTMLELLHKLRLKQNYVSKVKIVTKWDVKLLLSKFGTGKMNTQLLSRGNGLKWDFHLTIQEKDSPLIRAFQRLLRRSLFNFIMRAQFIVRSEEHTSELQSRFD